MKKWQGGVAALVSGLDKHKETFLKMALWRLLLPVQMSLPGTEISAQSRNFEKSQKNRETCAWGRSLEEGGMLTRTCCTTSPIHALVAHTNP